ncbi:MULTISPECIES: MBL fold metallo-hydrolase [unclassified Archaeoglobus]|jgi:glyoxylase-like metal-dependent hydrolase (beta-lactamase superfamily II)|uniref:MBL fold metallo-hydrolase n=1 Tax=unclassified Archaeoglobus TaxID=2643606 RepID=UPI0025C18E24|nr:MULTISPECIES: MBL fold metallo-hydrolase [unclassified Archaeoglobus]
MKLKSRGCNVYLIDDERFYLIDTGTNADLILKQVKELDGIIITHAHFDHFAAAYKVQKEFGCPVFAHRIDIPYLLGEKKFQYSGLLGLLAKIGERLFRAKPPEEVRDVDNLDIKAQIIHTPGHTPGSICILKEEKLYCGDLLRGRNGLDLSPKSFCSDYNQYLNSVKKIAELQFDVVMPGHGSAGSREHYDEILRKIILP